MNTRHDNTRQHILETGHRIIAGKGFASVGLNEILTSAGVPKGSFYHYFESKEQYGQALLAGILRSLPGRPQRTVRRRFRLWPRAPDALLATLARQPTATSCAEQKCLVVKLAGEVADLSEAMRITLRDGTDQVVQRIARVIEAGVADGSMPPLDPRMTAQTLYQMWLGASLLGKLHRDTAALENAMVFTRKLLTR